MKSVQRLSAVVADLIIAWALAAAEGFAGEPVESVPVWQRWERSFQADADPNTELVATLTSPSGKRRRVRGFFDGGNTWRVRFMPDEPGPWRFQTASQPRRGGLAVRSSGWKAQWFDPRTGKRRPARSSTGGSFRSPDESDWVLVFRAGK